MSHLTIDLLLARNLNWATHAKRSDINYFERHKIGQSPRCLWIGCADSRVPAENLVQAHLGELFVLRNVANQVLPDDNSMMSGIHYALTTLGVEMIIVCGHTHCGGVAYANQMALSVNNKFEQGKDPLQCQLSSLSGFFRHQITANRDLQNISSQHYQKQMVELNVLQQVHQLQQMSLIQDVSSTRLLEIYGCVYDLDQGELQLLPGGIA